MFEIDTTARKIGVTCTGPAHADVRVWAPSAGKVDVQLIGKHTVSLKKKDYGYWVGTLDAAEGDRYRILLDTGHELPDPASVSQPEGVHGPSEIIDLTRFEWQDRQWKNIPLQDYIIYELHTGTFTADGTFNGIAEKLDYLKALGITAIEIMPVAQFPGTRNWGYDGVFPFAVQNSYGGAKGLQQLVDLCHQKGLAVILDVVYNHLGPEGNYLSNFGPYFTDKYGTPWGRAVNFDDAWCDGVRSYFIENVLMLFRDFHIDALRMDAVHAIKDFSPTHILRSIRDHVDELMEHTGRRHYLIVECDLNDPRYINAVAENGYGMDAQWIDEFHHSLRVAAGQERTGYYRDFEGIAHLAKAYEDAYVYNGQYSPHRHKHFGVRTDNDGHQFVVFSQNHDQVGNRMLGERLSQLVSFEMQKLLAAAVMVSPYLPMLWMGEEYREPHPFLYFVSHTDPDLVAAVRKGRKSEFADFHAQGEAPDPQSEDTFHQSKLQWHMPDEAQHDAMLRYYKALIALRKTHPVLRSLNRESLKAITDEKTGLLILHRWHDEHHLLCLMNFSEQQQHRELPMPEQKWQQVFSSSDPQWGGKGSAKGSAAANSVSLPPESILIYANK
jgi:maltooligosyltrehalose trehalohydrolase